MKGSFYRYQAPKLSELKKKSLDELTPIHKFKTPKSNISSRLLIFQGDYFLISMITWTFISLVMGLELEILGPYQSLSNQSQSLIIMMVFSLPVSFLVGIAYFSLSHFYNESGTPINRLNKTRIVPLSFVTDGSVTEFQLTPEQSLKRALGHCLNYIFFFLPNLVMLIDEHKRSFPDILSKTITIEDEELIQLVQTKGAPEYQVKIDLETLETINQVDDEDDYLIAA